MAYKQRWLIYFDHFDIDHSGFIDAEDFAVIGKGVDQVFQSPPDDPHSISKVFAEFFIEVFDSDKDKKVSKDELLAGVEKVFIGKTFDQAPEWWKKLCTHAFHVFDKDKSGELSLEEVKSSIKHMNQAQSDENIKQAYEWAKTLSPAGKYDALAFTKVVFHWATSPDPTPNANVLLPFFGLAAKIYKYDNSNLTRSGIPNKSMVVNFDFWRLTF